MATHRAITAVSALAYLLECRDGRQDFSLNSLEFQGLPHERLRDADGIRRPRSLLRAPELRHRRPHRHVDSTVSLWMARPQRRTH